MRRTFLVLLMIFASASASHAQYQVPNHSVPIGRGAGVQGYGNAAPGAAGQVLTSNGPNVDPSMQSISASYGAKIPGTDGTCTIDDTAAIQVAINGAGSGGIVDGGGNCYLIGTSSPGAEVLKFSHPIKFVNLRFTLAAVGIGDTTDILHLAPAAFADYQGWDFENIVVNTNATANVGRHVFNLDTSAAANLFMQRPLFRNISGNANVQGLTNGDFFHMTPAPGGTGVQLVELDNVESFQCLNFDGAADGVFLHHVVVVSPSPGAKNCGVRIGLTAGAIGGVLDGMSIITANGGSQFGTATNGGYHFAVHDTAFEQDFTSYENNGTMIDVGAGVATVSTQIAGNVSIDSFVSKSTIQLTSALGISVGQTVTGTNIPGGCTVAQVSVFPENWIYLSCLQTDVILNGATIVVGGVNHTALGTSIPQALAVRFGTSTFNLLDGVRFGAGLSVPLIANSAGAVDTVISCNNYAPGGQTLIFDSGAGTRHCVAY